MAAERDLAALLKHMKPELRPGVFVPTDKPEDAMAVLREISAAT